ncbi:MAG: DUF1700 domain-containing protein [Oscillospiraceae bacterium]
MTRNEFFNELNERLAVLNEMERKDIVDEYVAHIEFRMQDGKTEGQAIEDFGDVDALADEILEAYHIDSSATKNKSIEYYLKVVIGFINQTTEKLLNCQPSDMARIAVEFVMVLFAIFLIGVPFDLFHNAFANIFYAFPSGISQPIISVFGLIIELAQLFLSFLVLYSFIKIRILERASDAPVQRAQRTQRPPKPPRAPKAKGYKKSNNYATAQPPQVVTKENTMENSNIDAALSEEEQTTVEGFTQENTQSFEETTPPVQDVPYHATRRNNGGYSQGQYEDYGNEKPSGGDFVITLVVNVLKFFLFLTVWLPFAFLTIAAIVCTVLAFILIAVKGIGFWGLCLIGLGFCLMGITFVAWLSDIIFGGKKKNA